MKHDRKQLRDIPKPERKLGLFWFEAGSHAAQVDLKVDAVLKMTSNSDPPPPPECWNDRHVLLYPASVVW